MTHFVNSGGNVIMHAAGVATWLSDEQSLALLETLQDEFGAALHAEDMPTFRLKLRQAHSLVEARMAAEQWARAAAVSGVGR